MRANRYSFLFVFGLILTLGLSTAFAASGDDNNKRPKGTGILTVRTTEKVYPVKIDGKDVGMSGVGTPTEFYLAPGFHTVEVVGPNGAFFKKEIEIRRDQKHCLCLKTVETTTSRPCPYDFHLEGPQKINEGDQVTFAAINSGTAPIPLRYEWTVTPDNVKVVSGRGTPTITIDSTGMGGKTINANLDVNDDVYDNKCRQIISVPTDVIPPPPPEPPKPFVCDEFAASNHDQDKARLDNCTIQVQNIPDAQMFVYIYPGTDKTSTTRNTYEKAYKFITDYLTGNRKFDPKRLTVNRAGTRARTTYQIWVVPPGAKTPVAQ